MKLKTLDVKHVSGGIKEANSFDLDTSSANMIIGMLTRQYSNPELAFVREISSNAYDSHTEAGTTDKPFDFQLPTAIEPFVKIRDYGTGLSKEFMLEKYTKVGLSTKRDSNEQIGGFGIGRLSFLTITEQAVVTSFYKGRKYSYTVNYNEKGELIISLTDERVTEEPDGLSLLFPVSTDRVNTLIEAVRQYFQHVTSLLPNFSGSPITIEPFEFFLKTDKWGITANAAHRSLNVVMGNVVYTTNYTSLYYDGKFKEVKQLVNAGLFLFFEVGEVIPLSTRENLDLCDQTLEALLKRLLEVKEEIIPLFESKIASADNYLSAVALYEEFRKQCDYSTQDFLSKGIKYKGVDVHGFDYDFKGRQYDLNFSQKNGKGNWGRYEHKISANKKTFPRYKFIFKVNSNGIRNLIEYNFPANGPNGDWLVLVDGQLKNFLDFKAFWIDRGFPETNFYISNDLSPPSKKKATTAEILDPDTRIPCFNPWYPLQMYTRGENKQAWATKNTASQSFQDLEASEYYIEAKNGYVSEKDQQSYLKYALLNDKGLLTRRHVLIINKNNRKYIKKSWQPFSEYVKDCVALTKEDRSTLISIIHCQERRQYLQDTFPKIFSAYKFNTPYTYAEDKRFRSLTLFYQLLQNNRELFLAFQDLKFLRKNLRKRVELLARRISNPELKDSYSPEFGFDLGSRKFYSCWYEILGISPDGIKNSRECLTRRLQFLKSFQNSQLFKVAMCTEAAHGIKLHKLRKELCYDTKNYYSPHVDR